MTTRPLLRLRRFALAPLLLGAIGAALPSRTQAATPTPAPAPAAATTAPQRTTATFGDWTLRCERPGGGSMQVCEIAQVLSAQGQPVAQIVMGRPARGEPLQLTILVPTSVTLGQQPRLGGPGKDSPAIDLAWRRCLPGGCLAAASMSDDVAKQLRARTDATRIVYLDGSGKEAALPFSPKGLVQALDALTREEAS